MPPPCHHGPTGGARMSETVDLRKEIELDATPYQVWAAVATGPGNGSWFFPMEIEPRLGGAVRITAGDPDDSAGQGDSASLGDDGASLGDDGAGQADDGAA